jgi:hypothetical protein
VGEVTSVGGADSAGAGERQVVVTGQEPGPKQAIRTGSAVRLQLGLSEDAPAVRAAPTERRGTPAAAPAEDEPAAGPPIDAAAEETPENERARGFPEDDEPPPVVEPPAEVTVPDPESPEDEPF